MVYLFAAYFVLWSITFGYLFVLGGRQRRLEQRLVALRDDGDPAGLAPSERS